MRRCARTAPRIAEDREVPQPVQRRAAVPRRAVTAGLLQRRPGHDGLGQLGHHLPGLFQVDDRRLGSFGHGTALRLLPAPDDDVHAASAARGQDDERHRAPSPRLPGRALTTPIPTPSWRRTRPRSCRPVHPTSTLFAMTLLTCATALTSGRARAVVVAGGVVQQRTGRVGRGAGDGAGVVARARALDFGRGTSPVDDGGDALDGLRAGVEVLGVPGHVGQPRRRSWPAGYRRSPARSDRCPDRPGCWPPDPAVPARRRTGSTSDAAARRRRRSCRANRR